MKNEFGQELDRNGYAESLWPSYTVCRICGRADRHLQRHEVFHGSLYRRRSKEYGCWVNICDYCHSAIHGGGDVDERKLKSIMQRIAMAKYGWNIHQFRERFGKNYLIDDEEQV